MTTPPPELVDWLLDRLPFDSELVNGQVRRSRRLPHRILAGCEIRTEWGCRYTKRDGTNPDDNWITGWGYTKTPRERAEDHVRYANEGGRFKATLIRRHVIVTPAEEVTGDADPL